MGVAILLPTNRLLIAGGGPLVKRGNDVRLVIVRIEPLEDYPDSVGIVR